MSDAPKRKRLEKIPQEQMPVSTQKFYCFRCGTAYSRQKGYFPVSHSPMYRGTGFLPFCNDCLDKLYDYYKDELGSDREAMRRICMKIDLYWCDAIFDMVERTAGINSKVRSYIGKTNIIRYIDKTYDDTIADEANNPKEISLPENTDGQPGYIQEVEEEIIDVPEDVILFWGPGYTPKMYLELEDRKRYWTSRYPAGYNFDIGEEALIRQICNLEIDINHDRAAGKSIDKNVNTLNTILGSANLKPAQKKDESDTDLEKMPLGVGIQKWEYYRPLPETYKDNIDVRGTIKNVTTWFLGHACKMVGLKNSYTQMYEDAMEELRVKAPELDDEDDDSVLTDIFGGSGAGSDE